MCERRRESDMSIGVGNDEVVAIRIYIYRIELI